MRIRPYQKLIVWQEAHELCKRVYALTCDFPESEKFGLISQMRRASYSIPMNLADGNGRRSKKEKLYFIDVCPGSLEELHYQSVLSHDLRYISREQLEDLDDRIQRVGFLLHKLRASLQ